MNTINTNLIELANKTTQTDGDYPTAISELSLYRRSRATEPMHCLHGFGLAITIQGGKSVTLGDKVLDYSPGKALLTTVDVPVVSHITRASTVEPYIGMLLLIEAESVVRLAAKMDLPITKKEDTFHAMSIETLDDGLHDALVRLLKLLDEPTLIPHLFPLIQEEIIMRLLAGAHGSKLRHFVTKESPSQKIVQAIAWLKVNFTQIMRVNDLAANAYMSPSVFRRHFKNITGMSPVQYQKQLRLQKARQLMLNQKLDVGSTAIQVGYESVSQFNREYGRLFGNPPFRDIKKMTNSNVNTQHLQGSDLYVSRR